MKHNVLKEEEIKLLFDKFSYPMVKPCLTQEQKDKAIAISKILWLFLVKGSDTEENIYNALVLSLILLEFEKYDTSWSKKIHEVHFYVNKI
jgi:hypothetical protein